MEILICLVGKTCSGKDTIQKELIKMGMRSVTPYTTRPQREGEIDGVSYHFITKEDFFEKKEHGFFAETTSYNVASGDTWHYGSAKEDLADDKVIIVNPYGLRQMQKIKSLNPVSFYIIADEETVWNRLRQRGDDSAEARRRLNEDDKDFEGITQYIDFALRNDSMLKPELIAEMILYTYKKVNENMAEYRHMGRKIEG